MPAVAQAQRSAQQDEAALVTARGAALFKARRYAEAEQQFRRALSIREARLGPDHIDVAAALDKLGSAYREQAKYADAGAAYARALAIKEKELGQDHAEVSASLVNLGNLIQQLGRFGDAETMYRRALAIRENILPANHPDIAQILNNLGVAYDVQGRLADAEREHRRALSIRESALPPDHPDIVASLQNLGVNAFHQGKLAEAEPLYRRAIAILEKTGRNQIALAENLNNLAALYTNQSRFADAEPLYRRVLSIREAALGANHHAVARAVISLADNYSNQSRPAEAEPLFRRVIPAMEKLLGSTHSDLAPALHSFAGTLQKQRKYAEAEQVYRRGLAIREQVFGAHHPAIAISLNSLALALFEQDRVADALPLVRRAVADGRARPGIALPVLFDAMKGGLLPAEAAIEASLDVAQRESQTSAAAAVNKLAVRLAAGNDRLAQMVRRDQDLSVEADRLDKAFLAAVSQEPARRDAAAEAQSRERLATITRERTELQTVLGRDFPDFAALSNPLPLKIADIQPLLGEDEALVMFAQALYFRSYVFCITRDGFDWAPVPVGGEALERAVAALRDGLDVDRVQTALAARKTDDFFNLGLAHDAYVALFGAIEGLLKDKKHILVVPTGALTALPFHLLVTDRPAETNPADLSAYRDAAWMLKRHAVTVLPSVATLKALRGTGRHSPAAKPMIGFADPLFNPNAPDAGTRKVANAARELSTRSFADFWEGAGVERAAVAQALPQLPDTADEVRAVAQKLGASARDLILGRDATETAVKTAPLSDYRVVYFATHGLVAGDIKGLAEPSLAFAMPRQPTDRDDGLLTASEIAELKLNADWVVLSACNTIAGDKPGAEALSGLARAFFYAGARALLVSHWAVDSAAATWLAVTTFDKLQADPKLGRSEALRQAMLDYINDTSDPKNAYPAYWAPFVWSEKARRGDCASTIGRVLYRVGFGTKRT
jgi:CHAT domain-containing protein/tetratricopeptide (TPR) repeat protein